jgi:TrmH family RNA methyltransferase
VKLLSLARDLQRRKARERHGLFVAEGVRAVEELLRSPLSVRGALAAPSLASHARGAGVREALAARGVPVTDVEEREFDSAADTESPQGVLAIGVVPARTLADLTLPATARLLLLDGIQDPGNLGTILRTAIAFDFDAVVALPGTVDFWNAKVVRSAAGALFHHPPVPASWEELDEMLEATHTVIWAADAGGDSIDTISHGDLPPRLALAVSNEGAGLSAEARHRVARAVGIPISPEIDSLNVAIAAGILMHRLRS